MEYDVAVVGAGAAGLATAIFAARRNPQLRIVALDGARKLGAKILVSGGGRCNVTNVRVTPEDFCGGSRNTIRRVVSAFTAEQTVEFFREIGVPLHEEQWGKLFPDSNSAKTVLEALLAECRRLGVQLLSGHRVIDIRAGSASDRFVIDAEVAAADRDTTKALIQTRLVVLATGGKSLPKTGSDGGGYEMAERLGHSIVAPTPALVPLVLEGDVHARLSGISRDVEVVLRIGNQKPTRIRGPMLWTHFGASGPAIMDASRHWHRARLNGDDVSVALNFLPGDDFPSTEQRFLDLAASQPKRSVRNALGTLLPSRLGEAILERLGVVSQLTLGQLSRDDRRRIIHALLEWPTPVRDSRGYNHAEATAGGVPLSEIDPATMASRLCPGLFLVGEILDVDGRIGGFNFQWAWSSGFAAGSAAPA